MWKHEILWFKLDNEFYVLPTVIINTMHVKAEMIQLIDVVWLNRKLSFCFWMD